MPLTNPITANVAAAERSPSTDDDHYAPRATRAHLEPQERTSPPFHESRPPQRSGGTSPSIPFMIRGHRGATSPSIPFTRFTATAA
ncbi:hypothetical protein DEO72_LG1g2893 [Vigna unguiculata]|uniref:Uncharacterized protein n=1 Tax=Vigna unguiculata TaxID=3917 RepID=A0A4D6KZ36_VIGUN|nr:hypothetical protein DEO72_LG1g2893 [Vigna unguiculata]